MKIIMAGYGIVIDGDRTVSGIVIKATEEELFALGERLGPYMYRDIDIVLEDVQQPQEGGA